MSQPDVNVPAPTAQEQALQKEQTELLRLQKSTLIEQQKQMEIFMPIFARQMGLELGIDKNTGTLRWVKETAASKENRLLQEQIQKQTLQELLNAPGDRAKERELQDQQRELLQLQIKEQTERLTGPEAERRKEIEGLLNERTLKALRGELEIDPALERDIASQGQTLKERLQQQLGPGFETSSAGIEAMSKFEESANVLRHQARKGELTLGEQLSMARQGADIAQGGANLGATQARIPGIDPLSAGGFAFGAQNAGIASQQQMQSILQGGMQTAGGLGQIAAGYQMPIGTMQQDRSMQLQANMQNATNQTGFMNGMGSMFGSIFGALPFTSDEYNKTILARVSETLDGMGIYVYVREGEEPKLGVIAQDVMLHRPHAVVECEDGIYRVHRDAL